MKIQFLGFIPIILIFSVCIISAYMEDMGVSFFEAVSAFLVMAFLVFIVIGGFFWGMSAI